MPGTTPVYGFPYQTSSDPPHGPDLGRGLAEAFETQLVRMDAPIHVQVFTSTGTWQKPAGAKSVWVRGVGGGAAGGGAVGGGGGGIACGGSGGAGGYCESLFGASELAQSVPVTIGAGGTGVVGGTGGSGGNTRFGAYFTAGGGTGGEAGPNSTGSTTAGAGLGGAAGGGNVLNLPGEDGATGRTISGQHVFAQKGASGPFGAGGSSAVTTAGSGPRATGYGAGGGNAIANTTSRAGGNGSPGIVVVITYF